MPLGKNEGHFQGKTMKSYLGKKFFGIFLIFFIFLSLVWFINVEPFLTQKFLIRRFWCSFQESSIGEFYGDFNKVLFYSNCSRPPIRWESADPAFLKEMKMLFSERHSFFLPKSLSDLKFGFNFYEGDNYKGTMGIYRDMDGTIFFGVSGNQKNTGVFPGRFSKKLGTAFKEKIFPLFLEKVVGSKAGQIKEFIEKLE